MNATSDDVDYEFPPITELSKSHRRVLGVLIEKAFTTQEYYPLTLKAVTTGCNQKSNRSPVTNYSEEDVFDVLDELREAGLVGVVHTESGRTERFRHYMRKRFPFSEPQLAIMGELLLRGRQQMGELRSRASRMVSIENLAQLREELQGLSELGYLQASGSLERRGIEIDHKLYQHKEGKVLGVASGESSEPSQPASSQEVRSASPTDAEPQSVQQSATLAEVSSEIVKRVDVLESLIEELQIEKRAMVEEIDALKKEMQELSSRFDDLRQDLGG